MLKEFNFWFSVIVALILGVAAGVYIAFYSHRCENNYTKCNHNHYYVAKITLNDGSTVYSVTDSLDMLKAGLVKDYYQVGKTFFPVKQFKIDTVNSNIVTHFSYEN